MEELAETTWMFTSFKQENSTTIIIILFSCYQWFQTSKPLKTTKMGKWKIIVILVSDNMNKYTSITKHKFSIPRL